MPLSDDQRAMLRLLANREQGYDDIAALMGISVDQVRAKVANALAQLQEEGVALPPLPPDSGAAPAEEPKAPEPAEPEKPAEETPKPVEPPAPPPAEEKPEPAPPKPAPVQVAREEAKQKPPASSGGPKISLPAGNGARAAIAAVVAVVVIVIVVLLVSGGGGGSGDSTTASTTPTTAEGAKGSESPQLAKEEAAALKEIEANTKLTKAILKPVDGSEATGIGIFGKIKKEVVLQVQAKDLEPSPKGSSYIVWLYKSPKLALRVGSVTVDKAGGIAAQFPLPVEVLAYVASGALNQIDISLAPDATYEAAVAKAKKEETFPAYTGTDVLRGEITGPNVQAASGK
jgi:hypothetical protein